MPDTEPEPDAADDEPTMDTEGMGPDENDEEAG
jgi:hypothetical protein